MTEQLQFDLLRRARQPFISARMEELVTLLEARGGWMTKAQLAQHGFAERELRELAETDATGEVFSYPGSPGYKAYRFVTEEEFTRCHSLRSQGVKMIKRFVRYWNRRHKGKPLPRLS